MDPREALLWYIIPQAGHTNVKLCSGESACLPALSRPQELESKRQPAWLRPKSWEEHLVILHLRCGLMSRDTDPAPENANRYGSAGFKSRYPIPKAGQHRTQALHGNIPHDHVNQGFGGLAPSGSTTGTERNSETNQDHEDKS